jgi:hypothetical protein
MDQFAYSLHCAILFARVQFGFNRFFRLLLRHGFLALVGVKATPVGRRRIIFRTMFTGFEART